MKMSEKEVDTSNELRVLSLFSGCGGMDLGFEGDFICHRKSISPQSTWVQEVIDEHWVRLQKNRFRTGIGKKGNLPGKVHTASCHCFQ